VTLAIGAAAAHTARPTEGTGPVLTFLLVLLMSNFLLTILMVLKRMHSLLTLALKEQPAKKRA
jgi:hypothetical protein